MSADQRAHGLFRVAVEFAGSKSVLALVGDLDRATASDLAKILYVVVERRRGPVFLNVGTLEFIDAAGLGVLARAARDLALDGEELVLVDPSPMLRRLLEITRLTESVRLEVSPPDPDRLGAEEIDAEMSPNGMGESERSTNEIAHLMTLPTGTDMVEGALRLVVNLAQATVDGADGVSVSLLRDGRVMTVAASDQVVRQMDAHQYATGEGPCLDASLEGRWFHAATLDLETRWPTFTPLARALGILAILSSPLLVRDQPVGALNIYSRTAVAFSTREKELAAVYAAEVSKILADADTSVDVEAGALATRLRLALQKRHTLSIAQGVLMERENIGEEDAFTLLRRFSQLTGRPLGERADDVIASANRPGPEAAPGPSL